MVSKQIFTYASTKTESARHVQHHDETTRGDRGTAANIPANTDKEATATQALGVERVCTVHAGVNRDIWYERE